MEHNNRMVNGVAVAVAPKLLVMCRIRIYKFHGFIRILVPSPSTRAMHSLNQSKPMKKAEKLKLKDEPREYMRNVIGKIYNMLKYSSWESAEQDLNNLSMKWDSYTVNQVLKSHPPMEKAWLFFNWVSSLRGFKHDHYTYTTMLDIFGEAGRVSSMKHLFQQMQEKGIKLDSVTYTSMMHWLSSSGNVEIRLCKCGTKSNPRLLSLTPLISKISRASLHFPDIDKNKNNHYHLQLDNKENKVNNS